ncbi:MAG: M20/M25/M40 family metallo-hydrolase [Candidatus Hydrogenedentota bacterium]
MNTKSRNRWAFGGLVLVLLAVVFAWWMSLAPSAVPASAPETEFSAERAHVHMRAMAQRPHPAGSKDNDRVCQYIQDVLDDYGMDPELAERFVKSAGGLAYQRAVLARIPGTDSTKAFAVDAHFDSVPYGPGATDDISGISAMLEAARALKASPPLKNDIIFVFTDQEEIGTSGAQLFRDHPWFDEVGVMLGLETRGTSGPALMFETSQENGFVIREMAKAGVHPRATSIMFDIYDRLPFGSDFGRYKRHVAGLNVAYIDDFAHYHTVLDNPEKASLDSLQHHGEYTLGLARHFAGIPLDETYAPNVTYFNTLGGHMVVYDYKWNTPLAFGVLALVLLTLGVGIIRRRIRPGALLGALLVQLLAMVVIAVPVAGVSYLLFQRFREMALYSDHAYALAYVLLALAVLLITVHWLRERIRGTEFVAAVLVWFVPVLFALLAYMPGGAYTATLFLFFGALYLLVLCALPENAPRGTSLSVLLILPALMLIAPALVMFSYTLTSMLGCALAAVVLLLGMTLAPQVRLLGDGARRVTAWGLAVLAVLVFAYGYATNLPSPDSPRLNCLSYGVDWDEEQAYWLSSDRELDDWTQQFFPGGEAQRGSSVAFLPGDKTPYRKAEAPLDPSGPAVFDVQRDTVENGERLVTVHYRPARENFRAWLRVLDDLEVYRVEVADHTLDGAEKNWHGRFELVPHEGLTMTWAVAPGARFRVRVREVSYGIPSFDQYTPRPPHMATEPNRTLDHRRPLRSEHTWAVQTVDLGG